MQYTINAFTSKLDAIGINGGGGTGIVETLTGNSGGAVSPTGFNINTVGTGSITVVGNPGTSTLTTQITGTTNHSLLVGAGTATLTNLGVATNGQIPIGSSAADPVLATITAGTGISVTNGAGSITIAASGSEMVWTDEATSFNAVAGNGYFITGTATATLPGSPTQGQEIAFIVSTGGALTIQANTGQVVALGSSASASAGTAASTAIGDSLTIVYRSTSTTWRTRAAIGNWTIT